MILKKLFTAFWRFYRRCRHRCVVCGHIVDIKPHVWYCWPKEKLWYCSMECMIYDGVLTLDMSNPLADKDGYLRKPSYWKGCTQRYVRKENYN
jgi:hypothetical protein